MNKEEKISGRFSARARAVHQPRGHGWSSPFAGLVQLVLGACCDARPPGGSRFTCPRRVLEHAVFGNSRGLLP